MTKKDLSVPPGPIILKVDILYSGRRLDKFVAHRLPRWSRTLIQNKIHKGDILKNNKPAKPSDTLQAGDEITIKADVQSIDISQIPLHILYEDSDFVAVDKEPNMIVHPAGKEIFGTVINLIHFHYKKTGVDINPLLCHRLDRETSGVLIVSKNLEFRRFIQTEFEEGRVRKKYLSIVEGIVIQDSGTIEAPLRKAKTTPAEKPKMETSSTSGQYSVTQFSVLERFEPSDILENGATFLAAMPKTGRTHQIRAHLAHFGYPVLCDKTYGTIHELSIDGEIVLSRQALHSHEIRFNAPNVGEISVTSPLHADMLNTLNKLRKQLLTS
ncbi:MAG: RluA family pseudouridine synthase [Planctomycetota bacterium]